MDRKNVILFVTFIIFLSCHKEKEFEYPLIQTGDVTDINSSGATFHARISNLGNDPVLEYGFVWDTKNNPVIDNSEKFVITGSPSVEVISQRISTTLDVGVTYYVRAFIRSNNYITYGKKVAFSSLGSMAPEIADFYPKIGNINDTLYILGENFSNKPTSNFVHIGNFQANVLKAVQDTLIILVPDKLNTQSSFVRVSILGNEASSSESFRLNSAVIDDFEAKTGTFGSWIMITGDHFLSNPATLHVYFDRFEAEIIESHSKSLTVIVPDSIDKRQCNINIKINNINTSSNSIFTLESFTINDISPDIAQTGEIITCTGNNFSPVAENNVVTVGGLQAEVVEASTEMLKFKLPLQESGYYSSRNAEIRIEVIGQTDEFENPILINNEWFRLPDSPVTETIHAFCVYNDGKAYIGLNGTEEFWSFDPQNLTWERLSDFPGVIRTEGAGFYINGYIYFGTGFLSDRTYLKDFWKYDIADDTWTQINDFTGEERCKSLGFSIAGKGYLTFGENLTKTTFYYEDLWEYDPATDAWIDTTSLCNVDKLCHSTDFSGVLVIDEIAYCIKPFKREFSLYTFDPLNNYEWNRIDRCPGSGSGRPIVFSLNDIPYFATSFVFYRYYNNKWEYVYSLTQAEVYKGIGFATDDKAYVGLGFSNTMWEYDPNR